MGGGLTFRAHPRQIARGRGAGTVTLYPAGPKHQLVVALQLEREHRSLTQVAWKMWLDSHDVPIFETRAQLLEIARVQRRSEGVGRLSD